MKNVKFSFNWLKLILLFLVIFLWPGGFANAADYYVATTGNNNNPGTEAQPWATLTYAESQLSSGDTLIVRGGTYSETLNIDVSNVTIQNYPGETPVIDGGGTLPGGGNRNYSLINISYTDGGVTFDGFEVKNSTARGISLKETNNNIVKNCVIYHIDETGIVVDTNAHNTLIEDCKVYEHNLFWGEHGEPYDWGSGIIVVRSHDTTIRGCEVYNGYGEGIIAGRESTNVIIEYCVAYDNRALQIYADTSKDVIIRYNLAYGTRNETYNTRYPGFTAGDGIGLAVEAPSVGFGDGAKIYGNLVANCIAGLVVWDITNTVIYNNIFVEAYASGSVPKLLYIDYRLTDHIVRNNIFMQTNGTIADVPAAGTYSNNLWSKTPEADAQGDGDVIGDPKIVKASGWNSLTAGAVRGSEFALQSTSPAINAGTNSVSLVVTVDYWGTPRPQGLAYDIGAYEYISGEIIPPPVANNSFLPQTDWTLKYVDSEEIIGEDGAATNAFDGDKDTIWHTEWQAADPPHPHKIQIDLEAFYSLTGLACLPRQDGGVNGRIKDYELYVSADGTNWTLASKSSFADSASQQRASFAEQAKVRYVELRTISAYNDDPWATLAEIDLEGQLVTEAPQTYGISNFIQLVSDWLKSETNLTSDLNNDNTVNTRDLGIMMSHWE